ncbi:ATP-binding protein [Thiobacillus sp.]
MRLSSRLSLTQLNALLLVVFFIIFELLVASAITYFLMLPMARRSAADLAGLMTLSAQTWSELPPVTRPAFEIELAHSHALALRAEPPHNPGPPSWREPYLRFLVASLSASGLARRTTRPLQRLQQAVTSLGRGQTPERLPETGPREIAALSRFNEMTKQVEDLLAARTVLLAGVSHDLRTPLARLRLAVEMLVKEPSAELAAQVEGDIEAMDRLIGDVMTLARGFGHEAARRVVLADLVRSPPGAAEHVQIEAAAITLEVPTGALRRILANLLENALRYGGGQPVTLQAETGDGLCRIGVLDRGPGIPAAEQEAVFRPFYRLEASRNVGTGGSGLGLAIVRQLAAAQGWEVSLQDRPGGGLAVWLQIALPQPGALI